MQTHEIYESVTNTIISLLESHQLTWDRPWIALGQDQDFARNPITTNYYRGINQFLLSFSLMEKGYLKNIWMTYNQIKKDGGFVRKGEKSTPVIFYKKAYRDKNKKYYSPDTIKTMSFGKSTELGITSIPILKLYRVFNVHQTSDLSPEYYESEPVQSLNDWDKDERAEALIYSTGANIEIIPSNRAYYQGGDTDKIVLPLREQFNSETGWYETALHELGHWTGHKTRLNREGGKEFGDSAYAHEELVAELSSAFCCATLGFSKNISSNAAYIKNWLGVLKQDKKAIVRAAAEAQKAADYIIGGAEYVAYST